MKTHSTIRLFVSGIVPGDKLIVGLDGDGTYSFRRAGEPEPARRGFRSYSATLDAAREHYGPEPAGQGTITIAVADPDITNVSVIQN